MRNSKLITLIAIAVGVSLGASAASAADLPSRPYTKATAVIATTYNWTGFYIGVHGGGMWADKDWTERCSALLGANCVGLGAAAPFGASNRITSAIGGVQAGYNWQSSNYVLGVEGDWAWAGNRQECAPVSGPPSFFAINTGTACSKVESLATLAGRFGVAIDRTLLYGKAGVAWAHDSYVVLCGRTGGICANPGQAMTTSPDQDRFGWTVGVGVEYAFSANWTVKAEYNYMDFGTSVARFQTTVFGGPGLDSIHDVDIRQHVSVAKVGLNYRFGGPVVAKY